MKPLSEHYARTMRMPCLSAQIILKALQDAAPGMVTDRFLAASIGTEHKETVRRNVDILRHKGYSFGRVPNQGYFYRGFLR
jgi:hypothetical protein